MKQWDHKKLNSVLYFHEPSKCGIERLNESNPAAIESSVCILWPFIDFFIGVSHCVGHCLNGTASAIIRIAENPKTNPDPKWLLVLPSWLETFSRGKVGAWFAIWLHRQLSKAWIEIGCSASQAIISLVTLSRAQFHSLLVNIGDFIQLKPSQRCREQYSIIRREERDRLERNVKYDLTIVGLRPPLKSGLELVGLVPLSAVLNPFLKWQLHLVTWRCQWFAEAISSSFRASEDRKTHFDILGVQSGDWMLIEASSSKRVFFGWLLTMLRDATFVERFFWSFWGDVWQMFLNVLMISNLWPLIEILKKGLGISWMSISSFWTDSKSTSIQTTCRHSWHLIGFNGQISVLYPP